MKDFPEYGRPRWRLGRWERNFGYRCILTCAQIEIMQADLPHTLYRHDLTKEEIAERAKNRTQASDEVIRLQQEAIRQMEERRKAAQAAEAEDEGGDEEKIYELDDLFD